MKKTKIAAAILAGVLAFTGVPNVAAPLTVSVSAASKLAAPTGIKATTTASTIKLSWKKVSGADAYRVYKYNPVTNKYTTYKSVTGTSCTVKQLSADTSYKFRVAALVKSGKGYAVQTKSAVQTVRTKLAAPSGLKATAGTSSVKLTWNKLTGADAYRVYKYNSSTKKYETYKNVSANSCTVSGLKAGTYQFRVAGLVESGKKYIAQTQSAAIKATVGSSSNASSAGSMPITFPAFGKSKTETISAMGIKTGMDFENIRPGADGYAGYKTINGVDTMVMLYFNENGKFFYGAAIIPKEAMTFTKAFSTLKSKLGENYVNMTSKGIEFYEWVNSSAKTGEFITGSGSADAFVYGKISTKYTPANMGDGSGDLTSSIDDIRSLIG